VLLAAAEIQGVGRMCRRFSAVVASTRYRFSQEPDMTSSSALARFLASEHRKSDPNISQVFWLENDVEVRLIEVTTSVPKEGTVMPFRFTADPPDVPLPSLVILIHPDDWNRRNQLTWPAELDPSKVNPQELKLDNGNGS
jgi:hypothetical protein